MQYFNTNATAAAADDDDDDDGEDDDDDDVDDDDDDGHNDDDKNNNNYEVTNTSVRVTFNLYFRKNALNDTKLITGSVKMLPNM